MLANRMFFWLDADWVLSSNLATAITFTGPSSGFITQPSSNFTVGANGSISGVLVVTISNLGGTGVLSQSVFSLSTGAATGTLTYTPSTLGTHHLSETNNQALTDAASLDYEVTIIPVPLTGQGGSRSKSTFYYRTDDSYWTIREQYLKHLKQQYSPSASTTYSPSTNELTLEVPFVPHDDKVKTASITPLPTPINVNPSALSRYIAEAETLTHLVKVSTSLSELTPLVSRLNAIHLAIQESNTQIALQELAIKRAKRDRKLTKLAKVSDALEELANLLKQIL